MSSYSPFRSFGATCALLAGCWVPLLGGQDSSGAKPDLQQTTPTITVVSPSGPFGSYMFPSNGSKLLIVIEITDTSNAGIVLDGAGRPEFVEPDQNVRVFLDHVTKQLSYTNGQSQRVIQLVSEVPLEDLVRDPHKRITPLVDWSSVPPDAKVSGITIGKEDHMEEAIFHFRVKDRKGNVSPYPTVTGGEELDFSFAIAFQKALYTYKPANTVK